MKTGKELPELLEEIQRQTKVKRDYLVDTKQLYMVPATTDGETVDGMQLVVPNGEQHILDVGPLAHRQISERLNIPAKYYDRMLKEAPHLLTRNVNHWFETNPERRMIRTLDGTARAFLSDRYQRIDNVHVAQTVLPILRESSTLKVVSCEVTESRLYIKAVDTSLRREVKSRRVGDVVEAGVMISNSEVGLGAVQVCPFYNFLVCLNGMVRNKEGLRSAHIGTRLEGDDNIASILADDTKATLDKAVLLKVRDVVRAALDADRFMQAIRDMEALTTQAIKGDPVKAVELLVDDFSLSDSEGAAIMRHLIEGGDLSRYGVVNAVTRTAEDVESYDRATELETLGGRLVDLSAANWRRIAEAA